ncbi:SulP family inorganic anion transporter [uncultured Hyphomonas sp.]|uniref:SulP family inorganic anion transporter n=1 Tax=uncultured Hyphomonas sp. TaxID=225298 RepID=UPI002AAB43F5|nr:SulP family inorganic anion transporter [uncultured Hyphomonas sp.]
MSTPKTAAPSGRGPFFDTSNLRGDLFGGLTAGIVALPLALAFGEASGAGPIAGLWGAIFVGFFAAIFGGTGSQVSGPTGPMVVVFAGLYAALGGNPTLVFAAVVLAGVLQIGFGVLKFGQYVKLVPYPVISGFMSGIGVIIIALQLSRLFGHEPDGGGTIPAFTAVPGAVMDPNLIAVGIAVMTLIIVFTWPKKFAAYVPGPLAALVIGTLVSLAIPGAPVLGDIPTGLPQFVLPSFSADTALVVLEAAFILAVLGSIDSLLTSLVADNMTRTRHDSDKELIGQGIGNTIAGMFGAIPGAGATMRTVINIRSGGRTRISGGTHALVLLAVVLSLGPLASQIPHAVLAGILVKVGFDTIDMSYIKRAHKGPRWDLALMVLVLGLTVFVDLITAVAVGVVLAALAFIKKLADDQIASVQHEAPRQSSEEEVTLLSRCGGRVMLFDFGGPLSFGAAADLGHHVRSRAGDKVEIIVLDFARVPFIDVSAVRAVETIIEDAHDAGKDVYFTGMSEEVEAVLHRFAADQVPGTEDKRFGQRRDALNAALTRLDEKPTPVPAE